MFPSNTRSAAGRDRPCESEANVRRLPQPCLTLIVRQPRNLKRMIAFDHAVRVVVDRLTRPCEQPRRGVFFTEDQVCIRLAALQGDAHGDLTHGAPRQRIGAAQRLRTENHMHAERTALPDQPVQQQCGRLTQTILFDEELLKLVDRQHQPRQRSLGARVPISGEILDTLTAKQIAPLLEHAVQSLQHADPELPVAFDRNHVGMRQLKRRVVFEFHTLS